jgi:hypothetical protein
VVGSEWGLSVGDQEGDRGGEGGEREGVHCHLCLVGVKNEQPGSTVAAGRVEAGAEVKLDRAVDEGKYFGTKSSVGAQLLGINHLILGDMDDPTLYRLTDNGVRAEDEGQHQRKPRRELPELVFIQGNTMNDLGAAGHVGIREPFALGTLQLEGQVVSR